jgi:hypothetical protein
VADGEGGSLGEGQECVTLNVGPILVGQADILESFSLLSITAGKVNSHI